MRQRLVTASWALPLLVAFIWFDTPWFPLLIPLVAVVASIGILEFYRLAIKSGGQPLVFFGTLWSLVFIVNRHFESPLIVTGSLLISAIVLPLFWLLFHSGRGDKFTSWAWTLMGMLYIGWMLSYYVALREMDQGREWTLLVLFSTFACDSAAYAVGRTWGKHQMAPSISPRKTWEGAAAGFVAAMAASLLISIILSMNHSAFPLSYSQALLLGSFIGVFAQMGDLWESRLKRKAGVKDSGSLLPGHGGILDRIDSIIFTGIVVYYYALWAIG